MLNTIIAAILTPTMVFGIVGKLWQVWGQPYIDTLKNNARWAHAVSIVELLAGGVVKAVYEEIVRALKNDGKFDAEERARALVTARVALMVEVERVGLGDIIQTLGQAGIDSIVERAVQAAKDSAAARQPRGRFASDEFARILDRRNVPDGHSVAADIRAEQVADPGTDAEGKQT